MEARDRRAFLHVAGCLQLDEQASVVPWERELLATQKIVDHLFVVKRRGESKHLEYVESLASWKTRDIEEIILRAMTISSVPDLWDYDIQTTIMIALPRDVPAVLPPEFTRFRGALRTYLDVRYRKTWEIPGREILDMNRSAVLPLMPLTRHSAKELARAADRLKREGDEELISQFLVNMAYVYNGEDVKRYEMLFAKETQEIAELTWVGKNLIAKGRKQGERIAQRRALRAMERGIRAMITERFPDLADAPELALARLPDEETGSQVMVAVAKARTRQQVRAAIGKLLPAAPSKRR